MSYTGVSDRAASHSTPSSRSTGQLAPYIPPRYLATNLRLPKTGLVNFGVTCYMNATLQALSATTPLSVLFLDDGWHGMIQRENWKGSKGLLPEYYCNLIRSLWKGDVEAIKPTSFRKFCGRLKGEWIKDQQHDAKEFFDFLLDTLHEDFNGAWAKSPLRTLTEQEEAHRESMPKSVVAKREWGRYTHRELSFITSLFVGQHASRLRCIKCLFTSTTYEAFYSISVEIPAVAAASDRTPTLADCLRSYCAEERLAEGEEWHCPRCKRRSEATKRITLTRLPQFFVVHFKRFSASHRHSARKVHTPVDFPLENLNLEPYMLPPPTAAESQQIAHDYGPQELKPEAGMTPPFVYDAYAVERHHGNTLTSGHYTCLVRDRARGCWREFDDTRVQDFQPERLGRGREVGNHEAYIVFYQRRGPGEVGDGRKI